MKPTLPISAARLSTTRAHQYFPWAISSQARAINLAVSGLIGSVVSGGSAAVPSARPVSSGRFGCPPALSRRTCCNHALRGFKITGKRGRPTALLLQLRRRSVRCLPKPIRFLGGLAEFASQCGDPVAFLQQRLPPILLRPEIHADAYRHDKAGSDRENRKPISRKGGALWFDRWCRPS